MESFIKKDKKIIFKMLIDGILIGIFSGLFSVLYRFLIMKMDDLRLVLFSDSSLLNILFIVILFFIVSIIISQLLKWAPLSGGSGIPQIRGEIIGKFNMNENRTIVSKLIGGSLGNLAGFSLGREGPSIQVGGAVSKAIGKILKRDSIEINYLITAGAGAGLAAAFNAPIAGTIFVMEELHKSFSKYLLFPTLIASIVSNYISFTLLGHNSSFSFTIWQNLPLNMIWVTILIGILTGVFGVIFNNGILICQKFFKKLKLKPYLKIFLLMIVAIFVAFNFYGITGGGHNLVENLAKSRFDTKYIIIILILKLMYTCFCYGSGVQGGIFLPTLSIGALCATIVFSLLSPFIDIDTFYVNFIILGMSGILASVVRTPILAVVLVTEMTGSFNHLLALAIVVIISYSVAELLNNPPIYDSLFENQLKAFKLEDDKKEKFSIYEYTISQRSDCIDTKILDINFPEHLIIIKIERNGLEFIPEASDIILAGDRLTILAKDSDYLEIDKFFKNEK